MNIGTIYLEHGQDKQATVHFEQSIQLMKAFGIRSLVLLTLFVAVLRCKIVFTSIIMEFILFQTDTKYQHVAPGSGTSQHG